MAFAPGDDLLAELMAAFSTESAEQLQALNRDLLALEQGNFVDDAAKAALLRDAFREAHTLKGGAAAVDLPRVRELAHHLESFFSVVQSGAIEPDQEDFDLLYRTVDALDTLITATLNGDEIAAVGVEALCDELDAAATADQPPLPADPGRSDAPEPSMGAVGADPPEEPDDEVPARSADAARTPEELVKIPVAKLDALMSGAGELVVARNAIGRELSDLREIAKALASLPHIRRTTPGPRGEESHSGTRREAADKRTAHQTIENELQTELARLDATVASLRTITRRADQVASQLHDELRDARMLPLDRILESFPRMVRDLAREQEKEVTLQIDGAETEVDRAVLEQIKAPLVHLLRNAVDHGIEEPDARRAQGKPAHGTVEVSAIQQGDTVRIQISDDGRGVDVAAVRAAAVAKGLVTPEDANANDDRDGVRFIFQAGLSTSAIVTEVSGRGVGLDVVRENVEKLGGSVEVNTRPNIGTTFSLVLPLTVALTRCLLVDTGSGAVALPIANVVRVLAVPENEVHEIDGALTIEADGEAVLLLDLAHQLGMAPARVGAAARRPAVLIRCRRGLVALSVDAVVSVEDLVVKSLPNRLAGTPHVAGAAILDTGEVVLVLNVADLGSSKPGAVSPTAQRPVSPDESVVEEAARTILLADDSLTTRTLEKNILQAAGYVVRAVPDGAQAWDLLQSDGADLLVSDVQMPEMDGFELTEKIRQDRRFQNLPIVLVTSLDTPADRRRGIQAGADAYIVKSGFDQEHLVDVIRRLI